MRSGQSLKRWLIGAVLAAGAVGAALAIAGVATPARLPLVLVFLAAAPAFSVAVAFRAMDRLARIVLAGTSAIIINFLVAEVMLMAGAWSPRAGVAAVGLISILVALAGRRISGRAVKPASGRPVPALPPQR
jgi:prepilin signal peptidase PulO-like enzyme (type II secretory pathway)